MNKNILILSEDVDIHNNFNKKLKDQNYNIFHMYNTIEALKFYELFNEDIDIVVLDEDIENIDLLKNKTNKKPTIYIKKPIHYDSILKNIIQESTDLEKRNIAIKNYIKSITNKENIERLNLIKSNFNKLLEKKHSKEELNHLVETFYLNSKQTQIHIKSILNYTDILLTELNNKILTNFKNYYHLDEKNKLIFKNNIEIYYGKDFFNNLDFNTLTINELKKELEEEKYTILLGSFFHDIGKNFVDPYLLDTEKLLNKKEKMMIDNHSNVGHYFFQLIKPNINNSKLNKRYENIDNMISNHHKWKYKDNEKIPYCERFVRFVDIYEALSALRSYKPAFKFKDLHNSLLSYKKNPELKNNSSELDVLISELYINNIPEMQQVYLENFKISSKYYNQYLYQGFYDKISDRTLMIIQTTLYNLIDNLSSFDNKYQKESEYLKNIFENNSSFQEEYKYNKYEYNSIQFSKDGLLEIDFKKIPNILTKLDKKIFEQWGFFDINDLKMKNNFKSLNEKNKYIKINVYSKLFQHIKDNFKDKEFHLKDFENYIGTNLNNNFKVINNNNNQKKQTKNLININNKKILRKDWNIENILYFLKDYTNSDENEKIIDKIGINVIGLDNNKLNKLKQNLSNEVFDRNISKAFNLYKKNLTKNIIYNINIGKQEFLRDNIFSYREKLLPEDQKIFDKFCKNCLNIQLLEHRFHKIDMYHTGLYPLSKKLENNIDKLKQVSTKISCNDFIPLIDNFNRLKNMETIFKTNFKTIKIGINVTNKLKLKLFFEKIDNLISNTNNVNKINNVIQNNENLLDKYLININNKTILEDLIKLKKEQTPILNINYIDLININIYNNYGIEIKELEKNKEKYLNNNDNTDNYLRYISKNLNLKKKSMTNNNKNLIYEHNNSKEIKNYLKILNKNLNNNSNIKNNFNFNNI